MTTFKRSETTETFHATDAAWQNALILQFGRKASDIRYTAEGAGAPGSYLRRLYSDRYRAYCAWCEARGMEAAPDSLCEPSPAMVPQQAQQQQACAAAFAEQLDVPPVCVEPNRLNRQDCEALAPGRRVQHRRHNWAGNTWRRLTIVEAGAVRATHDITGTGENGPGIARELVCAATTHDDAGRVLSRETIRFQVYAS